LNNVGNRIGWRSPEGEDCTVAKKTQVEILAFIDSLIVEGEALKKSAYDNIVKTPPQASWVPRIRTLTLLFGRRLAPWSYVLDDVPTDSLVRTVDTFLGALRAIKEAVSSGLLVKVENLILAEEMDSLLEQAQSLLEAGYGLAAGVLGRAVLEEHLRTGCERNGCLPSGRSTINDLNQALYKASHLDKLEMKQVESLAGIGNHCAHNVQPPLDAERICAFLRDIREFITRQPLD
jgi:hypothetical protein